MPATRAAVGRDATRTPDPDDTPTSPPVIQRSKSGREIKQPAHLSQEQESENQSKTRNLKHKRNGPAITLRGNSTTETTNPNPDTNNNETATQRLLLEVKGLREELLPARATKTTRSLGNNTTRTGRNQSPCYKNPLQHVLQRRTLRNHPRTSISTKCDHYPNYRK
jgi:hypothetical protein